MPKETLPKDDASADLAAANDVRTQEQQETARTIGRKFWPILNLFILGVLIGQLVMMRKPPPSSSAAVLYSQALQQAQQPVTDPDGQQLVKPLPMPKMPSNILELGDRLLLEGNPSAALRKYESLALFGQGRLTNEVRFRIAVCSEAIGNLDRALPDYRYLSSRNVNTRIELASRLGQAPVLYRLDKLNMAKQLLCRALVDRSTTIDAQNEIRGEFCPFICSCAESRSIPWGGTGSVI